MRTSAFIPLIALVTRIANADGDCPGEEYSCLGRCYDADYFGVMGYGHGLLHSAPGSINGWPIWYTVPSNSSIDNAAPGPWGAFPILKGTEDYYNGTQEVTAIVTWGDYGSGDSDYETSNIIDYGTTNNGVQTDCGGPDD